MLMPEESWARVAKELMGPLAVMPRQNRHVLVVADMFTKWVEAFLFQTW